MTVLLFLSFLTVAFGNFGGIETPKVQHIEKNGMTVETTFHHDSIWFRVKAPTEGWVAIGFNETNELKGNYLIMGAVINGSAVAKEHHVFNSGHYRSFSNLGIKSSITKIIGTEQNGQTEISFQLPITRSDLLGKSLKPDSTFMLLLAYSREDDFKHHSVMRTSARITL